MPVTDPEKKQIAQKARLHMKICFTCGARNPMSAKDAESAITAICDSKTEL